MNVGGNQWQPSGRFVVVGCVAAVLAGVALPWSASAADVPAGRLVASPEKGWPQWRGPRRDGVCDETGLLPAWPKSGPKLLWKITGMGKGYASPIVVGSRVYMPGDVGETLTIFALDPDGKIVWQAAGGKAWKRSHRGSRASCAYSAGHIYHMNGHGRVTCLDAKTGKEVWAVDTMKRFGAKVPYFGLSECLLVDGLRVIVTPGGAKGLMAALDKTDGKTLWTSSLTAMTGKPPETAGYSSPILIEFGGKRMIVAISSHRVFAVDAATGETLWTHSVRLIGSACSTLPVFWKDSIFTTNAGREDQDLYRLRIAPSGKAVEQIWAQPLCNSHSSIVCAEGTLYLSTARKIKGYAQVDPATGKTKALLPPLRTACATWADGRLYVLSQEGRTFLLKPSEGTFETCGQFQLVGKAKDAWAHPVICHGRLYLRYHDTLFCYDVQAK